ncbi:hypothetical protein D6D25_09687 [Aureobasidium pullulans]|nr:hypothetical protein D6D25_09687 [Aureobasidium pullulans]
MSNSSTSPEKQSLIPQLTPPLPTASPSEVRAFITELLILTRNLPAQHAKDIADKWHLGTGRELTTYPPSVYADIFGSEDAWTVYKESQLFIRRNKQEKNRRRDELRKWAIILGIIIVNIIGVVLFLRLLLLHVQAEAYALAWILTVDVLGLVFGGIYLLGRVGLEVEVERELHSGMSVGCKKCT